MIERASPSPDLSLGERNSFVPLVGRSPFSDSIPRSGSSSLTLKDRSRLASARVSIESCPLRRRESAMTLVELLVVLAVIAVLAALIFPLMTQPSDYRETQCLDNQKMLGYSFRIWEDDHGGKYPMAVARTN